jgi:2-polyprenyl-3-methyl-5-hydroxy-6-metoxy-1,4-benzoquinol methylase
MSQIVKLNNLERQENNVFRLPDDHGREFGYSDGGDVEQYLSQVFSQARDLSSRSRELQEAIIDWPSEYHLSSDRSNLLRCYDLSFVETALEFGSGCGAISRYLGEQGISVDAIEGSGPRAELCEMRCRDLDNVTVINSNYNELKLPEKQYDLVLFVGVIEYARKFHPQVESDREAAIAVLNQARSLLTDTGIIIVAIENRLGLKYILGHHEDHYSKRYIGIHGYPDSAGIATYSELEWRDIIEQSGFSCCEFSYPFPDYKIPRTCLGEDYAANDSNAFNHLEGIFARDYTMPARRSPTESLAWEAASAGKFLGTIANSFCVAIGNNKQTVKQAMSFDFCHMPGPGRKNEYAVITRKPKNNDVVQKIPLFENENVTRGGVRQILDDQPYLKGSLLSTEWLRAILIYARREEFDNMLGQYYEYLEEVEKSGSPLTIDLLPINIIVDQDGRYHAFDQEWAVDVKIEKEYLLFRALLTFVVTNWVHMKDFLGWLELHTVRDFVDYGFRNHKLVLARFIDHFVKLENQFQHSTVNSGADRDVEQLLSTVFDFSSDDCDVYASMCWAVDDGGPAGETFAETGSVELAYTPDPEYQVLEFIFPDTVEQVGCLRLDLFDIRKQDTVGFFSISEISLIEKTQDQEIVLWQLSGDQNIADHCKATSAMYEPLSQAGYWMASTGFPKLVFRFGRTINTSGAAGIVVRVVARVAESVEYILAHQRYLARIRQHEQQEQDLKNTIHHLDSARKEISDIKAGKPFRLGMKIFSWLGFLKR